MKDLTKIQQKIYDFIGNELSLDRPVPTAREVALRFKYRSHRAAEDHIKALMRKGWLASTPGKARSLRLVSPLAKLRSQITDIPVFGSIPAGIADLREQEAEGCVSVDFNSIGFKPGRNTFALRVQGDSMIGRHICDGDIVILEFNAEPRHGQVVAALVDGQSTLKTYLVKGGNPFLRAENPKYKDIIPAEELVIQGVLRGIIRQIPA